MGTREQNAFQRLKGRVTRPTDRFERVENGLLDGMLDVNYCINAAEGWIEIKAPREPVLISTALFKSQHPVSIAQRNWMLKQYNAKGRSWLFIVTEQRLMLIRGALVAFMNDINEISATELAKRADWVAEPPVRDNNLWFDLRELLQT